jgi:trimethylamine--corrinoid protein Co-methyltransferase
MTEIPTARPSFHFFDNKQCEAIHLATLEILRRTGTRVHHTEALKLLGEAGAIISDNNLVKFPPGLIEWALAQAPANVTLCKRGGDQPAIRMEGMNVSFGTGSDCLKYLDPRTGERRLFTAKDVIDCIKLVDCLLEIEFCMSMGIPSDLDAMSPYRHQAALMMEYTSKPIVFISGSKADCEAIVAMATAVAGDAESLRLNPTLLCYSQITTPLNHGETSTDKLLYMAEIGMPIVHMPSPMMGGTAPITMAGALALGNAEVLSGLVMHQLKNPGAPFVYGQGLHHIDMKTTISVYGAPEFELARAAVADMARYYHLPHWGYAGHTDSCVMDEQAASDATSSIFVAMLTGQHLAHDIGYMEAGLTGSPELIVFSAEMINRTRHFMQGMSFDAESLAMELIHQIGPGGDFLTTDHTLKNFRSFWQPTLFNRRRIHDWEKKGSKRLSDQLRDKTISLMESRQPEALSPSLKDEISYILHNAK